MSHHDALVDGLRSYDPVTRDHHRARIVQAAAELLATEGRDAVTTRAVAMAAGVQAPTIYRVFGDKRGLLEAVAEYGFAAYLSSKAIRPDGSDPVEDLRRGWDLHVGFGLLNPALYSLMYGDPRPDDPSPAARSAQGFLDALVDRIARAGRLRIGHSQAASLVHASGCGTVFTLLAMREIDRDPAISTLARETVVTAVTTETPAMNTPGHVGAATALRATLPETAVLTDGERALLYEWLDRLAEG